MPIDVVILTYNRLNYLTQTIDSLIKNTFLPLRIIIVDNASTDKNVIKYLNKLFDKKIIYKLIFLKKNQYMQSWFEGIKFVTSPYFIITDPDILLPDLSFCWLEKCINLLNTYKEIARIGLSLDPSNIPPCWNKKYKKMLSFSKGPLFKKDNNLRLVDVISTIQLIRKEYFDKIFYKKDEIINLDFWKKIRLYGLSCVYTSIKAYHLGWNEYKEYPDYLKEKNGKIGIYKEVNLLNVK